MKENIKKFIRYFDNFVILIFLFLFYIHLLTILWNLGIIFDILQMLAPAFGILFYYAGVLTENAKRNWFIGIRTPWTISNEKVWNKTHKIGGKLFKIAGLIAIFGIFLPDYEIFLIIVPVILASIYSVVYSYFEYKKVIKKK